MNLWQDKHPYQFQANIIYLDEEEWKIVYTKYGEYFLKKCKYCKDLKDLESTFNHFEKQKSKNYSLFELEKRGGTTESLRKKLEKRYFSLDCIEETISVCKEMGYLDDVAWTKSFIRVQRGSRYGDGLIAQKLRRKGISIELIEELLEKRDEEEERELVKTFFEGRYRGCTFSDPKEYRKVFSALVRRGFSMDVIKETIESYKFSEE